MRGFPAALFWAVTLAVAIAQQTQNPSPMVEHTRPHPRLMEEHPPGIRSQLKIGSLFVPEKLHGKGRLPLLVNFHGAAWITELAAVRQKMAAISIQLGSGSAVYATPFRDDPELFGALLEEAGRQSGATLSPITLSAWSAGYGAVREILAVDKYYGRIDRVLLIDGLHTGYVGGKPGPLESQLETAGLKAFVRFARDAVDKRKHMLVVHSEIFPGTFASTTETADYLLSCLGLHRKPLLKWGPGGMQQLSEARGGWFRVLGFAGNSAPDHVDQLHSLPEFLARFESRGR